MKKTLYLEQIMQQLVNKFDTVGKNWYFYCSIRKKHELNFFFRLGVIWLLNLQPTSKKEYRNDLR